MARRTGEHLPPQPIGRGAEWVTLYDHGGIVVQAGEPRMLLAMKLVSVGHRPQRDADDVAVLLSVTGVTTADEAEEILEEYSPGDGLPPRSTRSWRRCWSKGHALCARRSRQTSPEADGDVCTHVCTRRRNPRNHAEVHPIPACLRIRRLGARVPSGAHCGETVTGKTPDQGLFLFLRFGYAPACIDRFVLEPRKSSFSDISRAVTARICASVSGQMRVVVRRAMFVIVV